MTSMVVSSLRKKFGMMMTSMSRQQQAKMSIRSTANCCHKTLIDNSITTPTTSSITYPSIHMKSFSTNPQVDGSSKTTTRLIPTRHSRHHIPPIAPINILHDTTDKIIKSIPGTLFTYDSNNMKLSKKEEYEAGLSASHYYQEYIEYLLRGYSSMLQSSIVHQQSPKDPNHPLNKLNGGKNDSIIIDKSIKGDEIIDKMIQLVERIEEEGKVYVELRSKLRSQVASIYHNENERSESDNTMNAHSNDKTDDDDDDDDEYNASNDATEQIKVQWQTTQLISNYGAPPGPSAVMYDLTLDAIANIVTTTSNPIPYLYKARTLFHNSLTWNELDQKQNFDMTNINSIPTAATFNAFARISSMVGENKIRKNGNRATEEEIRDIAITNAFIAFDAVYHHNVVRRNSATYNYLIQTVIKFFPDCQSKGYILVTLWDKCTLGEGVLDENILNSLLTVNSKQCGSKFHEWLMKDVKGVYNPEERNGFGFPVKYSKNNKLRRFDKRLDLY